jgi:hypothetical protein
VAGFGSESEQRSGVSLQVQPEKQRMTIRALAARIAAMLVVFAATFIIVDVVYTIGFLGAWNANYFLSYAHIPLEYSAPDEELGFIRQANLAYDYHFRGDKIPYRTDSNGFRNSREQEHADVVFLGDSFTEAGQVHEEQTFVRLVESKTGRTVVNMGRGSYGPQQELIVLRRYGLKYRPKVVVWQLFAGNDLSDAEDFEAWLENPEDRPPLLRRYFSHSMLRTGLKTLIPVSTRKRPRITIKYTGGDSESTLLRYSFQVHPKHEAPESLRVVFEALENAKQIADHHGIRLIITVVPTMLHALRDYILFESEEDRERYLPPVTSRDTDFETHIRTFCKQLGCEYVDALSVFRRAARDDNRGLYIPDDEHLDTRGHEVLAASLVQSLQGR